MQVFRIYTEDVNYQEVVELVTSAGTGATFIRAQGAWKSCENESNPISYENSLIIELHGGEPQVVKLLAQQIQELNNQEYIRIVTFHDVTIVDIN